MNRIVIVCLIVVSLAAAAASQTPPKKTIASVTEKLQKIAAEYRKIILTAVDKAMVRSIDPPFMPLALGELVVPEFRLRARQLAEKARLVGQHAKLDLLTNFLAKTPERVIVFSEHLPTLDLLESKIGELGRPVISFSGSLSRVERGRRLERFRQESAGVFLATRAGSEGLNLQFCNQLVNYELPWNPMIIEQRIGRVHRIGQHGVFV